MSYSVSTPAFAQRRSSTGCFVVVLIVIAMGLFLWRGSPPADQGAGEKLPALDLVPLTGPSRPVTLDDLKGKVALVTFFATRCGPCRAELPHLDDLYDEFARTGDFVVLPVSSGGEDFGALRADTKNLLSRLRLDLPTYADPTGTTRRAFRQVAGWRGAVPTTFILDRQGVIRKSWAGAGWDNEMRATIKRLLDE